MGIGNAGSAPSETCWICPEQETCWICPFRSQATGLGAVRQTTGHVRQTTGPARQTTGLGAVQRPARSYSAQPGGRPMFPLTPL